MLNSAFDPLLYAAIRKPVRKGYMEIIKWTAYCVLCFVPWLKPKNNFGMITRVLLFMCIYLHFLDEVLGLKNTNGYPQNGTEQKKKVSKVNSDKSLSVECKHVTEVSTRITDTDIQRDGTTAATTINLSLVQEVTILKQNNTKNDSEVVDKIENDLPTNQMPSQMVEEYTA